MIAKPTPGQAPKYYETYFDKLIETDLIQAFHNEMALSLQLIKKVTAEKEDYRYQPGKWSVKEVVSHIIDTERIFQYRALRFSRKDPTPLPGYDENLYALNCNADSRTLADLMEEYKLVRNCGIKLFESMSAEMLDYTGSANNNQVCARSIGWMIAGHSKHHFQVILDRYL